MKTILRLITMIALLSGGTALAAEIKTVHVGLSPFLSETDRERVWLQLCNWISTLPGGTRIVFSDAYMLQTVVTFEIPQLRYDTPKARTSFLRPPMATLKNWFDQCGQRTSPAGLRNSAILRTPEYLNHVTTDVAEEPRSIVLIGSPLYQSQNETVFSFGEDRFPTDAHLACDEMGSVFGILLKQQRMNHVLVHWLYPCESIFCSSLYKDRIERFWNLFIGHQSGTMASFSADGNSVFRRAITSGLPRKREDELDPCQDKVEMWTIRREVPARVMTNAVATVKFRVRPQQSTTQAETNFIRMLEEQVPSDKTAIGIMWSIRGLDLDLYVWHHPGVSPLFYRNTRTTEGHYIHDYRDANDQVDYEYVILDASTDLQQASAFVNFYAGQTNDPVCGKVILRHAGRTYHGTFALPARYGNKGNERDGRQSSPFWVGIKLDDLIRSTAVAASSH